MKFKKKLKQINSHHILSVFLILFIVAVAFSLIPFKPQSTGFVTYTLINGSITSHDFSEGTFTDTIFDAEENAVVLDNSTTGVYTSEVFDATEEVRWDKMVYGVDTPANSSLDFSIRACDDAVCDGESFSALEDTLNLTSQYFQYKVDFEATGNSPKLHEVNITYSAIEEELSVTIESPEATSYHTRDITITISSTGDEVWFANGTGNETYTGSVTRTYEEGEYTLNVWASDGVDEVSSSVTFTIDLEYCGDGSCNEDEDCSSCSEDCGCDSGYTCESGSCVEDEEEEEESESSSESTSESSSSSSESSSDSSSVATGSVTAEVCESDWQCDEWSECVDESQTRSCEDTNACGTEEGKPAESQSCSPPETCSDGIKNQDEQGIDCGGVCEQRCGIFTIVGSVISEPLESGKTFFKEKVFGNWTGIALFSVIVLAIAGFVVFEVFFRKKFFKKIADKN